MENRILSQPSDAALRMKNITAIYPRILCDHHVSALSNVHSRYHRDSELQYGSNSGSWIRTPETVLYMDLSTAASRLLQRPEQRKVKAAVLATI